MKERLKLTSYTVDSFSGEITECLKKHKADKYTSIRIRLLAEDLLEKRFGKIRVVHKIYGESLDVTAYGSDDAKFIGRISKDLTAAPDWRYLGGTNIVTFTAGVTTTIPDYVWILVSASSAVSSVILKLCP